jgi:hypothetical protein
MIKLAQKSMASCVLKPLFVFLLLGGIFGIVSLRSGILTVEYAISELESKKMERLKSVHRKGWIRAGVRNRSLWPITPTPALC